MWHTIMNSLNHTIWNGKITRINIVKLIFLKYSLSLFLSLVALNRCTIFQTDIEWNRDRRWVRTTEILFHHLINNAICIKPRRNLMYRILYMYITSHQRPVNCMILHILFPWIRISVNELPISLSHSHSHSISCSLFVCFVLHELEHGLQL